VEKKANRNLENTDQIKLYAASGTGNTYRLGCWIKEQSEDAGRMTDLVMIDNADVETDLKTNPMVMIGLLFPVHGFMPPWSMIKFLFKMPRAKGGGAFCAATRGGFKLGPAFIPGIAGFATILAAFILLFKGYRLCGLFSLDMPSNFINFHWGLHIDTICDIHANAKKRLRSFIGPILDGRSLFFSMNNGWELFWTLILFWFFPVFPILYLLIGKLFMAKLMFSNSRCNSCGICEKFCPNRGIEMKPAGRAKRPFWTCHCETCMRCMGYCPKQAIEAGHSWGIILFFVTGISSITWLLHLAGIGIGLETALNDNIPGRLLRYGYLIVATLAAYRIFWLLNRVPAVNRFFTLTTLTHYYRRFHDPETRLKDMKPEK
jgi:Pyruvate/2-oxoacid:ferredoxin oxidoreductase delta subunit